MAEDIKHESVACIDEALKNQDNVAMEERTSAEHSEYDSADSYSDQEENVKIRSRGSDQDQSNSDTGGSLILEREEGDGQESVPIKKIDDDEDKKNPQYIPKRGTFYEHDDRTVEEDDEEQKVDLEKEKESKKKSWPDKTEKWSHDRYNEDEQTPKSKSELVNIYGYDIRNEDGPPRARRRRRYGRGPNKYTRNWEDEDAYNKPAPKIKTKKQMRSRKTMEEFPPLVSNQEENARQEETEQVNVKSEKREELVEEQPVQQQREQPQENVTTTSSQDMINNKSNQRVGSGRVVKPKKEIKDSDYRGFTAKTRLQRTIKTEQQKVLPPRPQHSKPSENIHMNKLTQDIERDMNKLSVTEGGGYKGGKHQQSNQRQGSVPPRLQSEQSRGSKRYSSMRQRSLPESATPPALGGYQGAGGYYPNEYAQQNQPPVTAAQQPPPQIIHAPSPAALAASAAPTTLLQPQFAPAPNFPAPFVTAAAPPGAFMAPPPQQAPPPPARMINFAVQTAGQQAAFAAYQGFQQQFTPVVTQPTELYQPQGGITYYSADQQMAQRSVPQKRPKAAIPIVAPPDEKKEELQLVVNANGEVVVEENQ